MPSKLHISFITVLMCNAISIKDDSKGAHNNPPNQVDRRTAMVTNDYSIICWGNVSVGNVTRAH